MEEKSAGVCLVFRSLLLVVEASTWFCCSTGKLMSQFAADFFQLAFLEGVTDCIIYSSPDGGENRKNRGFCFLDFFDHKAASDAKRKIHAGKVSLIKLELFFKLYSFN